MTIKIKNIFLNQKTVEYNEKIIFITNYNLPKEVSDQVTEFLSKIFTLENPIKIKIKKSTIKNQLYRNPYNVIAIPLLAAGTGYVIYNKLPPLVISTWFFSLSFIIKQLTREIIHARKNEANFNKLFNTIFLGRKYKYDIFVILHETIHTLNKKKIITHNIDTYLARAIEITAMLITKENIKFNHRGYDQKNFQEGEKYYYNQKSNKKAVLKINKIQQGRIFNKIIFFEKYKYGMFVAGIVKAMLDNQIKHPKIYTFLGLLAQGTLLEESLEKSINSDPQLMPQ